ncbi:MAG: hypothetical protein WAM58_17660 [Candidatus Acidiferrum sp.]
MGRSFGMTGFFVVMLGVLRFGILRTRGAGVRRTCEEEEEPESAGIKPALHGRGAIEEGFFPQRTRKGAAVLSARTSFGMTGIFWRTQDAGTGLQTLEHSKKRLTPRGPAPGAGGKGTGLKTGHYYCLPKELQAGVAVPRLRQDAWFAWGEDV